ncbi:hypothetical protein BAUCODRAFT_114953 [Baudoinia panamericana UAMH 10762]|uniref:USP domain-containing protein n=1 Tax=Baudoinia panamericana (strain UAMH 10762) TaxID=717646 RepID=M2N1T4_BAUPA|nr:uncharacterized protein BAUCODRAFT_114953 [Baudoinia panamericana UAMH 10762]EMC92924.1 hypothetical protein BAUCODRAFT_114953 [Baudoinia panamericana UAMH 10762]
MPERPLTIATYAAGASLAAITLVYVFGPTFFLDDEAANISRSSRKKGVVGLTNPANDCFINSVLQALAGLPELRLYLIREMHRRKLDGAELYNDLTAVLEEQRQKERGVKPMPEWKLLGLQQGSVTAGLKDVLDALNERPIVKKTISAQPFIRVVELSFRTRINRSQQDAQEFLQLVAERLADENHAASRVRRKARRKHLSLEPDGAAQLKEVLHADSVHEQRHDSKLALLKDTRPDIGAGPPEPPDPDEGDAESAPFPLEGKVESQVECSHCRFKPKPSVSSFVTLTLHVPYDRTSTSLNACLDGLLKVEHIDDFVCDRCRLEHALQLNARQLTKATLSSDERSTLEDARIKLEAALRDDPEKPPKDVKLPDSSVTPKRRITRHTRISSFPRILAIHLNRSVWDAHSSSSKNMAKVAFPETLPIGGLLDRKTYRLLTVVTHKGVHSSGHYETFRRQYNNPPYSTPASMGTEGIYSARTSAAPSPRLSAAPSPRLSGRFTRDGESQTTPTPPESPPTLSPSTFDSPSSSSASSRSLQAAMHERRTPRTSVPIEAIPTPGLPPLPADAPASNGTKRQRSIAGAVSLSGRKRRVPDRWWRISDEKVKECKTGDVLGQQREVYLLFYEVMDDV